LVIAVSAIIVAIALCFTICVVCFWNLQRSPRKVNHGEFAKTYHPARRFYAGEEGDEYDDLRDQGILSNSPIAQHKFMLNDVEMVSPGSTSRESGPHKG